MAATALTTHLLRNAPAAITTPGRQLTSSPTSTRREFGTIKLSPRQFRGRASVARRASKNNGGDNNVRELASEKAVESGQQVADDASKLSSGPGFAAALDAKAEDASDAASYSGEVREKVVDVASDMAVDSTADVEELATNDAGLLAKASGRSVEDTAEALESKAAEVSDREARKEASTP